MAEPRHFERLPSGVKGLDVVLGGGFFETGVYVIEGAAGAGKTILANQVCFHLAAHKRKSVYYTLLTEAHDRMMRFLQSLSFFKTTQVPDYVTYVSGFKVLELEGLTGVFRNIRDTIASRKAALVVIDGLVSAEDVATHDMVFKKFIHELQTMSAMYRCTVLLLTNLEAAKRLQAEHTMVDGIIRLEAPVIKLKPQRSIDVLKFRGAGQIRGTHTLDITSDGITVYPRVETVLPPGEKPSPQIVTRRPFDVPSLDGLLRGGVLAGSNTMIHGPSGTGKTVCGLHFVAAGVNAGERALFFTFYEQPSELIAKAKRLGLDLESAVARGDLRIVWQSSVEAALDKIGARLLSTFDELQPTRIVIDGVHGFQVTSDPGERIQDFFAAIADYLTARGAAIVFTSESEDILGGPSIRPPFPNASRMCQNIIILRFSELRGRLVKVLSIVKQRDSDFDASLRVLTITDHGISLDGTLEDASSLLGGQPTPEPGGQDR